MILDIPLLTLLTLTSTTTALPPPPKTSIAPFHQQQPILPHVDQPNNPLTTHFRPAIESDLPAIATITVEAFSPSAAWYYLIPDIQSHKKDIWNCLHAQIVQGWKEFDGNKTFLNVITVPSSNTGNNDEDTKEEIPVSFAVWNMRTRQDSSSSSSSSSSFPSSFSLPSLLQTCLTPPGTNLTRAYDYERQLQPVAQKFFYPSNGSVWQDQLYLNLLATHPEWDGNGFGARQVRWGLDVSRSGDFGREREGGGDVVVRDDLAGEEGKGDLADGEVKRTIPVTLLATPAGWPLYESLGFEGVENATIRMLDGLGELWFEVCKWNG